jgi:hypothetical protein
LFRSAIPPSACCRRVAARSFPYSNDPYITSNDSSMPASSLP